MRTPTPIASSSTPTPAMTALVALVRAGSPGTGAPTSVGCAGAAESPEASVSSDSRLLPASTERRTPHSRQYRWSEASTAPQDVQHSTAGCAGLTIGSLDRGSSL